MPHNEQLIAILIRQIFQRVQTAEDEIDQTRLRSGLIKCLCMFHHSGRGIGDVRKINRTPPRLFVNIGRCCLIGTKTVEHAVIARRSQQLIVLDQIYTSHSCLGEQLCTFFRCKSGTGLYHV